MTDHAQIWLTDKEREWLAAMPAWTDVREKQIADKFDALVADLARYRTALEEAADDLDKAANVFDGLGFSLNTAHFAGRAERARAALAGAEKEAGA